MSHPCVRTWGKVAFFPSQDDGAGLFPFAEVQNEFLRLLHSRKLLEETPRPNPGNREGGKRGVFLRKPKGEESDHAGLSKWWSRTKGARIRLRMPGIRFSPRPTADMDC